MSDGMRRSRQDAEDLLPIRAAEHSGHFEDSKDQVVLRTAIADLLRKHVLGMPVAGWGAFTESTGNQ